MSARLFALLSTVALAIGCAPSVATIEGGEKASSSDADGLNNDDGNGAGSDDGGGEGTGGDDGGGDDGGDDTGGDDGSEEVGFAFEGEYVGEMLVEIAWPSWGGDVEWDDLCENRGEWSVSEDGDLDGTMECDVFFGGGDPEVLFVEVSGAVDEDGEVGGILFYEMGDWVSGDAEIVGTSVDTEMEYVGEGVVELGWEEAEVLFTFDGGR